MLFQLACATAASDSQSSVVYIRVQEDLAAAPTEPIETTDHKDDEPAAWLPLPGICLDEMEKDSNPPWQAHAGCTIRSQRPAALGAASYLTEPSVLSRIQVHHVVSIRDVYLILLSGRASMGQNDCGRTSLVVLDDLDRLLQDYQGSHGRKDPHMAMSQLGKCGFETRGQRNHHTSTPLTHAVKVSVLIDTANHGSEGCPMSVAVSMTHANTSSMQTRPLSRMLFAPSLSLTTVHIRAPENDNQVVPKASKTMELVLPDMEFLGTWCIHREIVTASGVRQQKRYYAIIKDRMDSDNMAKRLLVHLGDA